MLLLFSLIALLGGCGLVVGHALLTRLDPLHCFDRSGDRVILSTWIGVLVLGNGFLILSLFSSLSPSITLPFVLLLLGISLWPQQSRRSLGRLLCQPAAGAILGLSALALGLSAYCSQVIVWYDTGLYHIQVIKWLSEYGLVPGLALIHSRFGFISSWFTLPAVFNHGILEDRVASLPGAFCLTLMLGHSLLAFVRIIRQRARGEDFFLVAATLLAASIIFVVGLPNSPSPDLPVAALILFTAWAMLAITNKRATRHESAQIDPVLIIPFLLAVGAISIKLSAVPLLATTVGFFLLSSKAKFKMAAIAVCVGIIPIATVGAAGILTSGCAFYPAPYLCISVPWSLGTTAAAAESRLILEWARWSGITPEGATAFNWIGPWLRAEWLSSGLLLLSVLALFFLLLFRASEMVRQMRIIVFLGVLGISFMLYAAPNWRFGLGYLMLLPALTVMGKNEFCAAKLMTFSKWNEAKMMTCLGLFVAIIIAVHPHVVPRPSYQLLDEAISRGQLSGAGHPHFNLLLPPRVWNFAQDDSTGKAEKLFDNTIIQNQSADLTYQQPASEDTYACGNAPLPCAPYQLQNIKLRDSRAGLRGGFIKINAGLD